MPTWRIPLLCFDILSTLGVLFKAIDDTNLHAYVDAD